MFGANNKHNTTTNDMFGEGERRYRDGLPKPHEWFICIAVKVDGDLVMTVPVEEHEARPYRWPDRIAVPLAALKDGNGRLPLDAHVGQTVEVLGTRRPCKSVEEAAFFFQRDMVSVAIEACLHSKRHSQVSYQFGRFDVRVDGWWRVKTENGAVVARLRPADSDDEARVSEAEISRVRIHCCSLLATKGARIQPCVIAWHPAEEGCEAAIAAHDWQQHFDEPPILATLGYGHVAAHFGFKADGDGEQLATIRARIGSVLEGVATACRPDGSRTLATVVCPLLWLWAKKKDDKAQPSVRRFARELSLLKSFFPFQIGDNPKPSVENWD